MLDDFSFNYWTWFIAALAMLVLEMALPGVVFLWLAIAAALTGVIALLIPALGWELQVTVFSVLAIVSVIAGRNYLRRHPVETEDTTLNRRGEQLVGRVLKVAEPIQGGVGKVKVGDSLWIAHGPDTGAGTSVRVTAVDGTVLNVEAVEG
ncbi:MAG: NfeD family protein [Sphingomonadales bacterium]|nr:NfeD family protein [Sphingomonadales bacterium]